MSKCKQVKMGIFKLEDKFVDNFAESVGMAVQARYPFDKIPFCFFANMVNVLFFYYYLIWNKFLPHNMLFVTLFQNNSLRAFIQVDAIVPSKSSEMETPTELKVR